MPTKKSEDRLSIGSKVHSRTGTQVATSHRPFQIGEGGMRKGVSADPTGRGSWTRALRKSIPTCVMHVVDFHDVAQWLQPEKYDGRLKCHVISDNAGYSVFPDEYFDFCFSFGVLCHNNIDSIEEILRNVLPKMKLGGRALHQYADWEKLDAYGWRKGQVPTTFRDKPDDEIWWPRNTRQRMGAVAARAGWIVISPDLELVKR